MNKDKQTQLTYRDAGVDIDRGNAFVDNIKAVAKATSRPGVLGGLGGFGALFELPVDRYRQPVLVAGTDGVGTKLKLAVDSGQHDGVGIDLVAMCVNDLIVQGAEPLFFLDYYATGELDLEVGQAVVSGIAEGCRRAGAALIGGETAEMPGMYTDGDYDLAGFCVGVVEKEAIIDGSAVAPGNALLGLASSGPHSNGYSLVRKILEHAQADPNQDLDGTPLIQRLLEPTRIYVLPLLALMQELPVHAMAHITGGGLAENLARVLPDKVSARIQRDSWSWPTVFRWLREQGNVPAVEMERTFNCGVGMVLVVPAESAERAIELLAEQGEQAWLLGEVLEAGPDTPRVIIQ